MYPYNKAYYSRFGGKFVPVTIMEAAFAELKQAVREEVSHERI